MKRSQDEDGLLFYSSGEDKIFRDKDAKGVLSYLLSNECFVEDFQDDNQALSWLNGDVELV